jgi:glucose/arabinose dehydrogenase
MKFKPKILSEKLAPGGGNFRIETKFVAFFIMLLVGLGGCKLQRSILPGISLQLVANGFTSPVALMGAGDGSQRLFVVDQTGLIWILAEGRKLETPFLDLRAQVIALNSFYDERGLLGLAFHPDFATNSRLYVSYSAPLREGFSPSEWDHTTYISEFLVSADDPNRADPGTERILLAIDKPGYNYEAGHLAFGPDGYLYIATGDSVRDPATEAGQFAQDTDSLLGKILRIDVNGTAASGANYRIPADNPFVAGGGAPEVFAYGFRNPYRFSFDGPERLFVADVGQALREEINLVERGRNYGWPVREGTTCFNAGNWNQPLESCSTQGLSEPIISYAHEADLSAVIGGAVYRGSALPDLVGGYIFGDWGRGNGHLFMAYPPSFNIGEWKFMEMMVENPSGQAGIGQLLGIGHDEAGEIYILTREPGTGPSGNSGSVYKLAPTDK